jgi:UDP-N-acetylmuramoylalanine--D-glutamate ligase
MQSWQGKRIAILGISVEGNDSLRFFVGHGATVVCCDRRTETELADTIAEFKPLGVRFHLGDAYLTGLTEFDAVVRTPGMNRRLPELEPVIRAGKLTSQTQIILDNSPAPVIGITGTKGKGTTSTLIRDMLAAAGMKTHLGGNVGIPLLSSLDQVTPTDWVVLELSSFQLEDVTRSPHIAVVLRITQEHLVNQDRFATNFHPTRDDYVEAKRSIVRYQHAGDVAIVNSADGTSRSFGDSTPARVLTFSRYGKADAYVEAHTVYLVEDGQPYRVCSADEIILRGDHNLENIAAAALAARTAGVPVATISSVARSFPGLEHRLERCGTVDGITYYDDSFSTVPETTEAAVEAFTEPMTLILGGSDKGSDYAGMARTIAASSHVRAVILIGLMGPKIRTDLEQAEYHGIVTGGGMTMAEIVDAARKKTEPGGVVVLSPACASFDMFKNYKERGNQFKHVIASLSENQP